MILSAVPVACVVQSVAPGFKLQRTGLQVRVCSALDASGPKIRPRARRLSGCPSLARARRPGDDLRLGLAAPCLEAKVHPQCGRALRSRAWTRARARQRRPGKGLSILQAA
jgi:hypothetical protein